MKSVYWRDGFNSIVSFRKWLGIADRITPVRLFHLFFSFSFFRQNVVRSDALFFFFFAWSSPIYLSTHIFYLFILCVFGPFDDISLSSVVSRMDLTRPKPMRTALDHLRKSADPLVVDVSRKMHGRVVSISAWWCRPNPRSRRLRRT